MRQILRILVIPGVLGMEVLSVVHTMPREEHAHSTSCRLDFKQGNVGIPSSRSVWHEVEWACSSRGTVRTTLSVDERLTS